MTDNDYPTLNDADAIALWKQGKDGWNQWVEDNPNYNIDFSYVDFSKEVLDAFLIDFSEFKFPNGNVNFSYTIFGNSDVSFRHAMFGSGHVNFNCARFGSGYVNFSKVNFGDGDVSFSKAKFGGGDVYFFGAIFGIGDVSFLRASFEGSAFFATLSNLQNIKNFSFRYASFSGPLDISSKENFPCMVDLTHTKTSHHVSMHGLSCTLPRDAKRASRFFPKSSWITQQVTIYAMDEDRARRLKELAEANKDYEKAKEFHIIEMQAARTHKFPYDFLLKSEFWYQKLSDYGRSITKPIWWLGFTWWVWSIFYLFASFIETGKALWPQAAVYSAAQMFAFIPSSRGARNDVGDALFCIKKDCPLPEWVYLLTFSQSILALILLFLLGLGLRHRYRI